MGQQTRYQHGPLDRSRFALNPDASVFRPPGAPARTRGRAAMALSALSGDEQGILFVQLCNVLDPGFAVA